MTVEFIVPLLGSLFDRGKQFSETPKGLESNSQVYKLLAEKVGGEVANFRDIEFLIEKGGAFSTTDTPRYLRLRDVEEGGSRITPLVYLDGHLDDASPYFRLQVVLVIHANTASEVAKKIALRFETPEKSGKHSYYHSQICVTIQRGSGTNTMDMEMELPWFPTSHPAWPMDAQSPIELLICVILSLYGKVVVGQIINEAGLRCHHDLFDELDGMRVKFRDVPPAAASKSKKAKKTKKAKKNSGLCIIDLVELWPGHRAHLIAFAYRHSLPLLGVLDGPGSMGGWRHQAPRAGALSLPVTIPHASRRQAAAHAPALEGYSWQSGCRPAHVSIIDVDFWRRADTATLG